MPTLLWIPGAVTPFVLPSARVHAIGYGGLLSKSLNHIWTSQAMLNTYEIEK